MVRNGTNFNYHLSDGQSDANIEAAFLMRDDIPKMHYLLPLGIVYAMINMLICTLEVKMPYTEVLALENELCGKCSIFYYHLFISNSNLI